MATQYRGSTQQKQRYFGKVDPFCMFAVVPMLIAAGFFVWSGHRTAGVLLTVFAILIVVVDSWAPAGEEDPRTPLPRRLLTSLVSGHEVRALRALTSGDVERARAELANGTTRPLLGNLGTGTIWTVRATGRRTTSPRRSPRSSGVAATSDSTTRSARRSRSATVDSRSAHSSTSGAGTGGRSSRRWPRRLSRRSRWSSRRGRCWTPRCRRPRRCRRHRARRGRGLLRRRARRAVRPRRVDVRVARAAPRGPVERAVRPAWTRVTPGAGRVRRAGPCGRQRRAPRVPRRHLRGGARGVRHLPGPRRAGVPDAGADRQLAPGAPRSTWEQPATAWVEQVSSCGYRNIVVEPLFDYWSSPAFLLTADA